MNISVLNPYSKLETSHSPITDNKSTVGFRIAQILKAILPQTWFCWISRGTIQLQSKICSGKWSYWSKLSDDIYVGAMPLNNWDHVNKITHLGIKAVLSINEDFEFHKQLFAEPVKADDWSDRGIRFKRISSTDLEPIKLIKLIEAVNFVVEQVNLGNPIYIHCTGGRGRSVSVAICSLIKINGYSLEKSIQYVKQCRPQVMLSKKQIESLQNWNKQC